MWKEPWFWIIVGVVVILVFGAPRLPALAKSVGQSMRIFRGEVKTMKDEAAADTATEAAKPSDDTKSTPSA